MTYSVQPASSTEGGVSLDDARDVVGAAVAMLEALRDRLDVRLLLAAQRLADCKGRLVVSGVGKSGIAARKIASTCASLGTPALFLHPTDAAHGDLGMLAADDLLLCISVSGEAAELLPMVAHARQLVVPTIAITANALSPLGRSADEVLLLPDAREGGPMPMVPMASTVATIVLGDALATLAAKLKSFSSQQLAILHPAGRIGKMLKPAQSIMHAGQRMPVVAPDAGLAAIAAEIGDKGFGVTAVVDPGSDVLLGIITDGDLRRNLARAEHLTARDLMTPDPLVLAVGDSVDKALDIVRNHRVGAILVVEPFGERLVGIVHVQDLLRLGLV